MSIAILSHALALIDCSEKSGSLHRALIDRDDASYNAIRSQEWPPVQALRELGLGLRISPILTPQRLRLYQEHLSTRLADSEATHVGEGVQLFLETVRYDT